MSKHATQPMFQPFTQQTGWTALLLAGLLSLGAFGARAAQPASTPPGPDDGPIATVEEANARVDDAIAADIAKVLGHSDQVRVRELSVDVDAGVVTLHGLVATPAEKHLTSRYVRDVEGVQGVVNAIVVNPRLD